MLSSITLLILCQLLGEIVARSLGLAVPGSVIGMVILFAGLCVKGDVPKELNATAKGLLSNLSLLFVPAGVGLMDSIEVIRANWMPIAGTLVLSTAITLGVTAGVMQAMRRSPAEAPEEKPGPEESKGEDPS